MDTTTGLTRGEDDLARPAWANANDMMRTYYDTEWGMPIRGDDEMFERLVLEGFQAGLSWSTILAKRDNFRRAFDGFVIDTVAAYSEEDVDRLVQDASIVRNRRKIEAAIDNARAAVRLREKGGLAVFIWSFQPEETPAPETIDDVPSVSEESKALAKALKKEGFKFVGPTTMFALMEAVGIVDTHLVGSHRRGSSGVWV